MHHTISRGPKSGDNISRKRKRGNEKSTSDRGTEDDVLLRDIRHLLGKTAVKPECTKNITPAIIHAGKDADIPETEVTISELSSTGDGLALSPAFDHVYSVPFTVPGDIVRIRVYRTMLRESYSLADLVEVVKPSQHRNDSLVSCQYFAKCGGCQFQMLPYEYQLKHKKRVIEKAYVNFSGLDSEHVPIIHDTMASPLQYGYRTKLTPHFSLPGRTKKMTHNVTETPNIGFMMKGRRKVMDIEDCPLGTDIVRTGLTKERKRVADNLCQFKAGATLLIRENTLRLPKDAAKETKVEKDDQRDIIQTHFSDYIEEKSYITDQNAISSEYIDDFLFHNVAGTFFQNNNSILSPFTQYVRDHALPPSPPDSEISPAKLKYLLDAYCGSGLFTITLSSLFRSSLGVDVSKGSIESARENARLNNLKNTGFAAADAAKLFQDVPYPPDQTLLVIDPPRKGCDMNFLDQMLVFGPARVVYVSCNVHTQARDVGVLVRGDTSEGKGKSAIRYKIESIRGFDFFPQTGHVESVAILNKVVDD
ncbi:tRNA(m5U54)methyltransferase [Ophidiomyces ophidiicola]|uniref:tRNA(M5U54)methyltransferase n=1 Tax=Ophidiomyces ophidiicola TaxID=1387563 RepID=A0ACB8UV59_9EURO|nr:tRNA(m5U54)methyltransferase [Ophidiomyces ophidiicola]KAI1944978.1 tRNA(m5U54)methyltransferase [Ophidiomyces ophidiicola]KAI1945091.1 tRNA(m5U54)methyltransferase [Ophidiomyces ophidiicola]KAI1971158.1 tRNA(m5U54)methyltransferase [Ophidiomyces ophidiicola]KAI2016964.1 tRNA(m5U54)methyltransferase [Ophidiomyces ophidiicola]KAI2050183.1 tRNA(m5U54)methyltransferase [Ophidiomyces ophidiicola]